MKFSGEIKDIPSNEPLILVVIRGLFVCLLAYYSKTYEWISMKFSGKIKDSTSNKPLHFGSDPYHDWSTVLDPMIQKEE